MGGSLVLARGFQIGTRSMDDIAGAFAGMNAQRISQGGGLGPVRLAQHGAARPCAMHPSADSHDCERLWRGTAD